MIFEEIGSLFVNVAALSDWRYWVMWAIGGLLIYLAIAKDMEPTLLLPLGFGTILVNIPLSGAIDQVGANGQVTEGALTTLFNAGIANEPFPADPVYRHWRDDRLWAGAFQSQADDFWRGGAVWYLFDLLCGFDVLWNQ